MLKMKAAAPVTNDAERYPLPLLAPKDYTIQNTHDCLQKAAMNLIYSALETQESALPKAQPYAAAG
ncbi:hypothetical protein [Neorhizobium galegae]|uniref:hypothetical protein n=1 Tax=Neorhizobium galegae TaxID=399 RepID=UPI002107179C|nr:hypothetical protein [Neorhizobium galegae]MCQ1851323.1 hypothetical protein [Neorhizobium galegae]